MGASADLAALLLAPGSATLVLLKGELSVTRAQIDVSALPHAHRCSTHAYIAWPPYTPLHPRR